MLVRRCTCSVPQTARTFRRFQSSYYAQRSPFDTSPVHRPLWPWVTFAFGTSAATFSLALWYTSHDTANRRAEVTSSSSSRVLPSIFRAHDPSDETLAGARFQARIERARSFVRLFPDTWRWPVLAGEWYVKKSEAQLTAIGLIGSFVPVYLVWQLRSARGFAKKWLWHDPLANRPVTLLTSVFSHRTLTHLAFNSIALYSIGSVAQTYFSQISSLESPVRRSTSSPELLAFFVGAGLMSSLASHVFTIRYSLPKVLRGFSSTTTTATARRILPSLGASGAVYGCLAVCAMGYPQLTVSLIFFPFFSIPIGAGFGAMVAFDLVGLVRGWQIFDHVAHLTGGAVGLLYWLMGHDLYDYLLGLLSSTTTSRREATPRIAKS